MCRSIVSVVLLLLCAGCTHIEAPPCPFVGEPEFASSAGCLALIHGKILVVESLRYGGITPPGGKSLPGESAQCTAHRETYEETGLDLIPRQRLAVFETGFYLYYCEIYAGSGQIDPPSTMEVRRGFWLPVEEFDQYEWRFKGQGEVLRQLLQPDRPQE